MSIVLQDEMISALRRYAKSVMVISCASQNGRFAMSATAVSEVSIDPPSMLVCINRSTKIFPSMASGGLFCINMLQSRQEDIARNCGGLLQGEDRFSVGDWADYDNIPYLQDAQANFFCRTAQSHSFGTHDIFIGEVIYISMLEIIDPLVYVDGSYKSV